MLKCYKSFFLLLILFSSFSATAQDVPNLSASLSNQNRFFVGGNVGLQVGSVTLINLAPYGGYMLTENLAVGLSITYQYYSDNTFTPKYTTSIYGGSVFSRYYFSKSLFAHVEYELLNYEVYDYFSNDFRRIYNPNVLLGGGYRQMITNNSFFSITVLWNANDNIYSLYQNPIIRIGFSIGI